MRRRFRLRFLSLCAFYCTGLPIQFAFAVDDIDAVIARFPISLLPPDHPDRPTNELLPFQVSPSATTTTAAAAATAANAEL